MHFLKENKTYLFAFASITLVFFYFDRRVIVWMRAIQEEGSSLYYFLEVIDPYLAFISHGATLITVACLLYVIGKFTSKRLSEAGKYLCMGFIMSGLAVQTLKHLIGRARPRYMDEALFIGPTFKGGYDSFPSGHATEVFCFAYILSQYFPRQRVLFYSYAIIVALERIEDCSHFPSDVLAGGLLGMVAGKLLLKMFKVEQLHENATILPAPYAQTKSSIKTDEI